MDWVKGESKRIEEEKKKRSNNSNLPPLNWYNLKVGETIIRLAPPWDSLGIPFFNQSKHWAIPPETGILPCLTGTWPTHTSTCYVCDALAEVQELFPELKLWKHSPSSQYLTNAVVRDDPEEGEEAEKKGVRIVRLPEIAYNWLLLQLNNPKIGSMVFDIQKGCDIKISLSKKKIKGKKDRSVYAFTFMPGVSPLHEDPKVIEEWCSNIVNIPKVIKYPSDEDLLEMHASAQKAKAWWIRKFRKGIEAANEATGTVVGKSEPRDEPEDKVYSEPEPTPKPKAAAEKPANVARANEKVTSLKAPLQGQSPAENDKPSCYAGLEAPDAHDNGSYGFQEDLDKCMICPHELQCMDAKESKGL